jgi:hypothetical protein
MPVLVHLPASGQEPILSGDTHSLEITVREEGVPIPLTGLDAEFTAKLDKKDADNALTNIKKSLGEGIEYTDPDNGVVVITIDAADTENLEQDTTFYFDLQLSSGPDDVFTPIMGDITFTVDVTQRT